MANHLLRFVGMTVAIKKQNDLGSVIASLNKQFGDGTVRMVDSTPDPIKRFSSGVPQVDAVLGGGWPVGRICEIYGGESAGKTLLCLHTIASVQKDGGTCAIIDAEHALDMDWAARIGVCREKLLISQPGCGEEGLAVCESLIKTNMVDLIVVDSVAALTPRAELEGEQGDVFVGLQARMMGQAMRRLTGAISKANCTVIFVNQIREKIGVTYGSNTTTPGGRALKFYASIRAEMTRTGQLKNGEDVYGAETKINVIKNKTAAPFQKATISLVYGVGFCEVTNTVNAAIERGIIEKNGAWMSFDGRRYQGLVKTIDAFRENSEEFAKLKESMNAVQRLAD